MTTSTLFGRGLNHLLAQTPGAMELLRRHAGKVVRFDLTLRQFDFRIGDEGDFHDADTAAGTVDAILRPTPTLFARLPFFGRQAWRDADYSGDAALLATLDKVFRHLDWDIEADLAPLVGDIAAHQVGGAARSASQWLRQSARTLQSSAAEYWVEEAGQMARRVDVERFARDVDTLVDDVARLEARLARLEMTR